MNMIQSKKLTRNHIYGRVEFFDGNVPGFTFIIIKQKSCVTVSQPVRRASKALLKQFSQHKLEDRVRAFAFFKDKLNTETGQGSGPPATGARSSGPPATGPRSKRQHTHESEPEALTAPSSKRSKPAVSSGVTKVWINILYLNCSIHDVHLCVLSLVLM